MSFNDDKYYANIFLMLFGCPKNYLTVYFDKKNDMLNFDSK